MEEIRGGEHIPAAVLPYVLKHHRVNRVAMFGHDVLTEKNIRFSVKNVQTLVPPNSLSDTVQAARLTLVDTRAVGRSFTPPQTRRQLFLAQRKGVRNDMGKAKI